MIARNVWSGKTATLSGAISDGTGGGKLAVTGNLAFAGTIEVGARVVGEGTEGTVLAASEIAALRKQFAAEIAELKAKGGLD